MPHAIWKGNINFGLVYIPVALYSAEAHASDVKFSLLDKRDLAPIGYQKINKNTGEKVSLDNIVEGFEYEKDHYVVLSKKERKNIQAEGTQSIDIVEFVDMNEINPEFFNKPYYLEPLGKANKVYALFREALSKSNKVGIAKIIIRSRQYLAAVMVDDKALVLELLRYSEELVDQKKFDFPTDVKIAKSEMVMAEKLISTMTHPWNPNKYKNDYRKELLRLVSKKVKKGEAYEIPKEIKTKEPAEKGKIIDIMSLLKKSIEETKEQSRRKAK